MNILVLALSDYSLFLLLRWMQVTMGFGGRLMQTGRLLAYLSMALSLSPRQKG